MLRFTVFDDKGVATDWPLRSAYVVGHDNAAIAGDVRFENGCVVCEPPGPESAALALQWDAGDVGELVLQTCLLPQSETAYLLSLELARHRIMLFLTKLEEWARFDAATDLPEMTLFERARTRFMDALSADRGPGGAYTIEHDRMARESLRIAIEASERLAESTANEHLERRLRQSVDESATVPAILGCAVNPERSAEALQRVVADTFDFISVPTRWADLEPEEGQYRFAPTDRWIEWGVRGAKMPVTAGPIIDLSAEASPDWIYIWEHDYETLRDLLYEHVKRVVTRYRRAVSKWNVASGLHLNTNFALSLEQVIDLTRLAAIVTRKLHPSAKIQVEIDQPFGESAAINQNAIPPMLYAEILAQAGLQIDSFGLRIQMGDCAMGRSARDLMQLSAVLDHYAVFEKPISVSMLGVPSEPPPAPDAEVDSRLCAPGRWRSGWSEQTQADWATSAISVALSKSFVSSVTWQALFDTPANRPMPAGGLITQAGQPKRSLQRMAQVRKQLRQRRGLGALIPASA